MAVKRFLFIRHAKTQGNLERRYIGDPEESLCEQGLQDAMALATDDSLPSIDALMSGPALRCRQTAALLFPGMPCTRCLMHEIDFGIFTGKNADDLFGYREYGQWLETGCMGDIPGGDSVLAFKQRCCDTFLHVAKASCVGTTALVIHGGNIMAILERFTLPKQNFYDYHVPNCGFFLCCYENEKLTIERKSP